MPPGDDHEHRPPVWARRGDLRWTWLGGRGLGYYKRAGAKVEIFTWLEDWFHHSFTDGTLRRLGEAGFNLVTIPYSAGFGRRVEGPWREGCRDLVERCRSAGLRALAALDLGGLCAETIPAEEPDWAAWLLREPDGRPVPPSPAEYWRYRPDVTQPGFRALVGGLIDEALSAGFAGVWLDDVQPRPSYGAEAIADWHVYLAAKTDFYQRKVGYPAGLPLAPPPVDVQGDPLCGDWDDFWHERFTATLAEYRARVKAHDPDCLLVVSGPFQEHHHWERYRRHVDAVHLTNPWAPGARHGEIVSQAAFYLIGDAAGVLCFGDGLRRSCANLAEAPAGPAVELAVCEGPFFGGQVASAPWAAMPEGNDTSLAPALTFNAVEPWHLAGERPDRYTRLERCLGFLKRTAELHRVSESAATIAILHSRASLKFDQESTILNLRAAQLACLRRHLPADVLASDDLARLERYDVLIVPEQACLSREALTRIGEWVRAGGGLILVGEAGVRARRGRLRPTAWLVENLGVNNGRRSLPNAEVVAAGAGRVLALPALGVEPYEYPSDAPDPSAGWDWLPDAVHDVSAWPVPVTIQAPETLFCRGGWLADGNLSVMLLNYDVDHPVADAELILNLDWPTGAPTILWHTPAADSPVALTPRRRDAAIHVALPPLEVYAVVEVRADAGGPARTAAAAEVEPLGEGLLRR